jgi:hypothetical protein
MAQSPAPPVIPSRLLARMFSDKGYATTGTAFFEARNLSLLSEIAFRRVGHRLPSASFFLSSSILQLPSSI